MVASQGMCFCWMAIAFRATMNKESKGFFYVRKANFPTHGIVAGRFTVCPPPRGGWQRSWRVVSWNSHSNNILRALSPAGGNSLRLASRATSKNSKNSLKKPQVSSPSIWGRQEDTANSLLDLLLLETANFMLLGFYDNLQVSTNSWLPQLEGGGSRSETEGVLHRIKRNFVSLKFVLRTSQRYTINSIIPKEFTLLL